MSAKPVIVFVPGAWHGPDGFHLVIGELQAAGYETRGVDLASVGASTPLKDFQPDVDAIQETLRPLADDGKDIVLVVHSYGGIIGNEAVQGFAKVDREKQGKKGGVVHIYFCCAFAMPEGTSLMDGLNNKPLPWFVINDAGDIVNPATPVETFYNDVKEPEKYVKMLKPHSYRTFASKATYAGWKHVPSTYLLCEKDEAIPIHAQKGMVDGAQKAGADMKVETVDASHSPFISMPEEMARSVRRAAGESV
jgi:pimeloyl-ACP methyl ester carboxylesterase